MSRSALFLAPGHGIAGRYPAIFPEADQDQLLRLYWNRAGVKRELAKIRKERFDLLDKIKDQESEIFRAREQLQGLERLLIDPVAAANAMVYFQLRHLWKVAGLKVQQFARELTAQRERKERARLHAEVLAKRERRMSAVKEKLKELLLKRKSVIEERIAAEEKLKSANVVARLLTGRKYRKRVRSGRENQEMLDSRISELNDVVEKIQGEPLPEPEGLSLESKRVVNVAIIALAQHLVAHFAEHDLAVLAKRAVDRPVAEMKFGDRRSCDRFVELIRERVAQLEADKSLADSVKRRTDQLMTKVSYRHETDAIPLHQSVGEVPRAVDPLVVEGGGLARRIDDAPIPLNVLLEEYWDLHAVLL